MAAMNPSYHFSASQQKLTSGYMRPQHNPLFGFPLVMCFQKLPVFTLLGDCSVGFQALFFDFGRTYPVGSGSGRP
jgi:hypothetical protein